MSKREEIQQEALDIATKNKRCGLAISMGVGKTLIGLQYIDHYQKSNMGKLRILVVAPKLSIFDSWIDDSSKFNIPLDNVQFTTYLSLHKKNPHDYDIVVLDECHSLLNSHVAFLKPFTGKILGLTGTPPRHSNTDKGKLVSTYCPMLYKYITDDAVSDDILNDYRILVHKMPLSNINSIPVKMKSNGMEFYTSERKSYDYWTKRIGQAISKKQEQIASVMRMRVLMDFRTKETYVKKLLGDIDDKCIVFCNTQDQSDRICKASYHSNNPESEENLQNFKEGNISELSCVLQLNEGINIPHLRAGIIMHAYGNERKSSQRLGRLLRLNPTETAYVHILCYKDTVDERWLAEALRDLDPRKIKYFDVNTSSNEL
jgi:superfamily II DNA or RNA helicase